MPSPSSFHSINRRNFLKSSSALAAGAALSGVGTFQAATAQAAAREMLAAGVPNADKLGWRIGVQSYTFNRVSLFESIDKTASLGLKYLETCPGQRISPEEPHGIYSGTDAKIREMVKAKLQETGVTHTSHYEPITAETAVRAFSFCKDMGLEMLITDPPRIATGPGSIEFYEKVAIDHGVKLVLTNHPAKDNAAYSDPDWIVDDCKNRSEWVGASCDPGHFMRGGFVPKDAVAKYIKIGRMYHFHLRDVDKLGPDAVDVPMGEGTADIPWIFEELLRNKLKPLFLIEYERDFDNPMAQMIPSVKYINDLCGKLLASHPEAAISGS